MPKPLPTLATTPQPYARRANSPALKVAGVRAVSVTEPGSPAADEMVGPDMVLAWTVVPLRPSPGARVGAPAKSAELLQVWL
jgi:hypothetical protein